MFVYLNLCNSDHSLVCNVRRELQIDVLIPHNCSIEEAIAIKFEEKNKYNCNKYERNDKRKKQFYWWHDDTTGRFKNEEKPLQKIRERLQFYCGLFPQFRMYFSQMVNNILPPWHYRKVGIMWNMLIRVYPLQIKWVILGCNPSNLYYEFYFGINAGKN